MPQIIVTATRARDRDQGTVMFRERVTQADFESQHFQAQLVERISWAVGDASEVEQDAAPAPRASLEQRAPADAETRAPEPAWAK